MLFNDYRFRSQNFRKKIKNLNFRDLGISTKYLGFEGKDLNLYLNIHYNNIMLLL